MNLTELARTDWEAYKKAVAEQREREELRDKVDKMTKSTRKTREARVTDKHRFDKSEAQKKTAKARENTVVYHIDGRSVRVAVHDKMTVPKAQPMLKNPKRELFIENGKRVWRIVC